jgi:hypothetical protein
MLIRTIAKALSDSDYDFFLSFPNKKAAPIFKRAGYNFLGLARKYIRLFDTSQLLVNKTPIPDSLSQLISPVLNQLVKLIYPDTWIFNLGRFETRITNSLDFDIQHLSTLYHQSCFATYKTIDYLKWKYEKDPNNKNSYFYIRDSSLHVVGCIVFCVDDSHLVQVRDILYTQDQSILPALLSLFFKKAKKSNYEYAYTLLYENSGILTSHNNLDLTITKHRREIFYMTNPAKSSKSQLEKYLHSPCFNLFASDQDN